MSLSTNPTGTLLEKYFRVHPRKKYNLPEDTMLSEPQIIGDFSIDGNKKFHHDKKNLKFVDIDWTDEKEVEYDLTIGIRNAIRHVSDKSRKLYSILSWIVCNLHIIKDAHCRQSVDFICFRGLLTTLLCTPYENKEGWIICATKFKNTIYLFAYDTPEKKAREEGRSQHDKDMCSWGYKFEQYMTDSDSALTTPVNENEGYACVLRTTLCGKRFLYCAEVDAVDRKLHKREASKMSSYVEFKTTKSPNTDRDLENLHRYKFRKWWAQSYLAGIPHIICGFKEEGTVTLLKTFEVSSLPKTSQEFWKKNVMLNFMSEFLDFVKEVVKNDDPYQVYKFTNEISSGGIIKCTHYPKSSEWSFLPDWYIHKFR